MPYSPLPTPPKTISPSCMLTSGTRPPSGVNESCIELTAPHDVSVVTVANSAEAATPKRHSLPSMIAARNAEMMHDRIAGGFRPIRNRKARRKTESPSPLKIAQPWRVSLTILPYVYVKPGAQQEDQQHLDEIGERRRVFVGRCGVGVDETAAVGAQLFDDFLRRHRAAGDRLGEAFERLHALVGMEVLRHALPHEEESDDDGNRQ